MQNIARLMLYISPEMKNQLLNEVERRKKAGEPNATLVALANEAFEAYFYAMKKNGPSPKKPLDRQAGR